MPFVYPTKKKRRRRQVIDVPAKRQTIARRVPDAAETVQRRPEIKRQEARDRARARFTRLEHPAPPRKPSRQEAYREQLALVRGAPGLRGRGGRGALVALVRALGGGGDGARVPLFLGEVPKVDPVRTGKHLVSDIEEAAQQFGPQMLATGRALGEEARKGPSLLEVVRGKKDLRRDSPLFREVIGPTAADIRYSFSHEPTVIRYERGQPIYRAKSGGETRDPTKARTSIASKIEEHPLPYALTAAAVPTAGGSAIGFAGRAGLAGARGRQWAAPRAMHLETESGERVRTGRTSRNPWTRFQQEQIRELTTKAIPSRVGDRTNPLGEHARAARVAARQQRRRETAEIGRALRPFDRAVRKLKKPERVAVVLRGVGVRPSAMAAFVRKQADDVEDRLDDLARTQNLGPDEAREVRRLRGELSDHVALLRVCLGAVPPWQPQHRRLVRRPPPAPAPA